MEGVCFRRVEVLTMDAGKVAELARLKQRVAELEAELGLRSGPGRAPAAPPSSSEELLPLVLEYASDMISVHAGNGDYLYASPAITELLGWDASEVVGCNAYELIHPEDLAHIAESHASHQQGEPQSAALRRRTYRLRTKDGGWRWVETTTRSHHEGGLQQIVCVTRDAQAQVDAQEALLEANSRLEHFAAAVAHDLKAPLMVVSAHASLVEITAGDDLSQDQRQRLGRIRHAAEGMGAQIDALLTWARSGQEARPDTPTDLNDLVGEVLGTLALEIESRGAKVQVDSLPVVPLDPSLGRVLFQNLIGNALKYGREGVEPEIRIEARQGEEAWDLSVVDNGRGIAHSDQERIFGMFQRGANTEPGGHGVGLAMCARIAELHNGRLTVESERGEGTTFHVHLPSLEGSGGEDLSARR